MVDQEYVVLLNDDYEVDNNLLQTKLEELLLAQNENISDKSFNKRFSVRVVRRSQVTEELQKDKSSSFSLAALTAHNTSGESLTAWSQRGPGWYRDRWLLLKVTELENELLEKDGEGDDTELMALHRNLTAQQEKVKRRDAEIARFREELHKEDLFCQNNLLAEEVSCLREDLGRRDEKIKELEVVKVKNNGLTKYQKLLEQQVALLASKGDLLSMLKKALEEE